MGSQTACSGPLEINGIPAPNSYYQAASDPYLLCGKCSQSHFILAHTHTHKHTQNSIMFLLLPGGTHCGNLTIVENHLFHVILHSSTYATHSQTHTYTVCLHLHEEPKRSDFFFNSLWCWSHTVMPVSARSQRGMRFLFSHEEKKRASES